MERERIIVIVNGERISFEDLPPLIPVPSLVKFSALRATAYRYAAAGGLPVRRFGGRRLYVVKAKLRELLENGDGIAA